MINLHQKWKISQKGIILFSLSILVAIFFLRTYNIRSVPAGTTFDEIIYATEARTINAYGTDITGSWRPYHFAPSDSMYTELTSTVLLPGMWLFPDDPIVANKVVPIVLGTVLPFVLAGIAYYFDRDRWIYIGVLVVAACNPWIFQFSRMGFDSLFSVCLYSIGILLLLYLKRWWKLLSFVPFFFGFFQYQGHKIVLVPLVALTCFSLISTHEGRIGFKKFFQKQYMPLFIVLLACVLLTVSYLIRLPQLSSSVRQGEFSLFKDVTTVVDQNRRLTIDTPLLSLMDNKYVTLFDSFIMRFIGSFDLHFLFVEGNTGVDTFAVTEYGYFYYLDALLVIFACMLYKKRSKNIFLFMCVFIIIGTFPNVIRNGSAWITFRGAFVFIGIVMLAGYGLGRVLKDGSPLLKKLLLVGYILSFAAFIYIYFFRYPLTHTIHNGFYERVLASYIKRQPDTDFFIVPDRADATFDYLLTYNNLVNSENKDAIYISAISKSYILGNVQIEGNCPEDLGFTDSTTVSIIDPLKEPCPLPQVKPQKYIIEIKSLVDSGTRFRIYNDTFCNNYSLSSYPNIHTNILNVEKLSDQEFCQNFFSEALYPVQPEKK